MIFAETESNVWKLEFQRAQLSLKDNLNIT